MGEWVMHTYFAILHITACLDTQGLFSILCACVFLFYILCITHLGILFVATLFLLLTFLRLFHFFFLVLSHSWEILLYFLLLSRMGVLSPSTTFWLFLCWCSLAFSFNSFWKCFSNASSIPLSLLHFGILCRFF